MSENYNISLHGLLVKLCIIISQRLFFQTGLSGPLQIYIIQQLIAPKNERHLLSNRRIKYDEFVIAALRSMGYTWTLYQWYRRGGLWFITNIGQPLKDFLGVSLYAVNRVWLAIFVVAFISTMG